MPAIQVNTIPAWSKHREERGILTEEEVQQFIDLVFEEGKKSAAQAIPASHIAALIAVLYSYGCRISEAMELTRKDIVIDNRYVWANFKSKKKRRKEPDDPTKRSKPIPATRNLNVRIDAPFIDYLLDHVKTLSNPDERLFYFTKDTAQKKINWIYGRKPEQRQASMEDTNLWCHLFRDTCLTQLARAGASPYQLMTWAGWSSLQPAMHYIERSEQMTEGLDDLRNTRGFMRPKETKPVEEPKEPVLPKPIDPVIPIQETESRGMSTEAPYVELEKTITQQVFEDVKKAAETKKKINFFVRYGKP